MGLRPLEIHFSFNTGIDFKHWFKASNLSARLEHETYCNSLSLYILNVYIYAMAISKGKDVHTSTQLQLGTYFIYKQFSALLVLIVYGFE